MSAVGMDTRDDLRRKSLIDQMASISYSPMISTGDDRLAMLQGFTTVFRQMGRTPEMLRRLMDPEFHFQGQVDATAKGADEKELLRAPWYDSSFVIPNYSNMPDWVQKMAMECEAGRTVVAIVPNRSNTCWFHEHLLPKATQIRFIQGRLTFNGFSTQSPFPDIIVIFRPDRVASDPVGGDACATDVRSKDRGNRRKRVAAIMSSLTHGTEIVECEEASPRSADGDRETRPVYPPPQPPKPPKKPVEQASKLVTRRRGRPRKQPSSEEGEKQSEDK